MNIFKRIYNFIFRKKEPKLLNDTISNTIPDTIPKEEKRNQFRNSIAIDKAILKNKEDNKIETLISPGDGLGIDKNMKV